MCWKGEIIVRGWIRYCTFAHQWGPWVPYQYIHYYSVIVLNLTQATMIVDAPMR